MDPFLSAVLLSFLLTLATELAVAAVLGVRSPKDFCIIALVNLFTNPTVNLIYDLSFLWFPKSAVPYLLLAAMEIGVVLLEAFLFSRLLIYKRMRFILFSLILNGASFSVGLLVSLI